MKKKKFSAELAYVLATLILAFGTAMMTKANFGVSMVVAILELYNFRRCGIYAPGFSLNCAVHSYEKV